jgi:hypothetical protein
MTLKELRKELRGLDENMQVFIANHDHSEWETDACTSSVDVRNQDDYKDELENELDSAQPTIEGNYIVISG